METQTKNATIPEHAAAKGISVDAALRPVLRSACSAEVASATEDGCPPQADSPRSASDVKGRLKYQSTPFRPKATLLLDVLPAESVKTDEPSESSEGMLQQLLMNTEASAQRTQSAKRNWQLASLVLVMMLVAAVAVIGLLYVETNATRTPRGQVQTENPALNAANVQITGLKGEVDTLLNRNIELVSENSQLKSQSTAPIAAASLGEVKVVQRSAEGASNTVAASKQAIDTSRVEAIRKGSYPNGTAKAELIAALGEPDRVYKSRNYEQLVYFNRKPGRFWFIGNWLVQTAQ
jgi:hypothetical protein